MDRVVETNQCKGDSKYFNGDIFVNMFFEMSEQVSDNAAPFLKHR